MSFQLISVRLDHLDKKYTTILERYHSNQKNIAIKLEEIKSEVSKLEAEMATNTRVTSVCEDLNEQFDARLMELRADAKNWLSGMVMTLDLHAREQLENISFDAAVMQEQRGISKLDDMAKKLRNLHGNVIEELKAMVNKRETVERQITQRVAEETKKLLLEKTNYENNKQAIKTEMTTVIGDLRRQIAAVLGDMGQAREEFEDFVLDNLEKQMTAFTSSKNTPSKAQPF
ncbi:chromosome segregation ATPase, putative [Babesia ovis]|uniref:Chromosome segregation ATPase, putative n=1 Tax=Babesia ovis TaxID=5869 RepID=A0A9W5T9P1_BABOV|nr:chromosome segregation ATPase, putative [Babesia ovis]